MDAQLNQAIVTLLATLVTGGAAIVGAWVNAYVSKIKRESKDQGAAEEKIRRLERSLGLPESPCLKTPDSMHAAIREIEKKVLQQDQQKGD